MRHLWLAAVLALAGCEAKTPPEPGAGLAACETKLSGRSCRCAFEAMPTERFQTFVAWAETQPKGRSEAGLWEDPGLHEAMVKAAKGEVSVEQAAKELAFLKATCGTGSTQHAQLNGAGAG